MIILITGITGQDGSYISEHFIKEGHIVHGIIRRSSNPNCQFLRLKHVNHPNMILHYGDITDSLFVSNIINKIKPDEIYHLAAQSHVEKSFGMPKYTTEVNSLGTLYILESVKNHSPHSKIYHAATSEMFGNEIDDDGYQRETTPMHPVSPYGCSKLYSHNLCNHYKRAYGMFVCSGILFNHESPRRGEHFVTSKVVKAAAEIKSGDRDILELGNMTSYRDWGHALDYIKAMILMVRSKTPNDYVIATGETKSVEELVNYVFDKFDLDPDKYIRVSEELKRKEELWILKGDSSKAKKELGWTPEYNFESTIDDMIKHYKEDI